MMLDPEDIPLTLSQDEQRRSLALMLGIKYHAETIIREASMYQALKADRIDITPSQVQMVVMVAREFELFLKGEPSGVVATPRIADVDDGASPASPASAAVPDTSEGAE